MKKLLLLIVLLSGCGDDTVIANASASDRFISTAEKVEVDCAIIQNPVVFLTFGQSNAANSVDVKYTPVNNIYNVFDGKCYKASDPLLGASGALGSTWTRLADKLMNIDPTRDIIIVSVAVGGSSISQWQIGSDNMVYLVNQVYKLRCLGLTVDKILFHQGESDAASFMPWDMWVNYFNHMYTTLRKYEINAPIYVAQATSCLNNWSADIRYAQWLVAYAISDVHFGPDTDTILDRYDGCHFSGVGADKHADLWLEKL